jgi:hypothetical protein
VLSFLRRLDEALTSAPPCETASSVAIRGTVGFVNLGGFSLAMNLDRASSKLHAARSGACESEATPFGRCQAPLSETPKSSLVIRCERNKSERSVKST